MCSPSLILLTFSNGFLLVVEVPEDISVAIFDEQPLKVVLLEAS